MEVVKIAALLADEKFELRIDLLAGEAGLSRRITSSRIQKPGLALAGFLDHLHLERLQVFGNTEMSFLGTLPRERQIEVCEQLFAADIAALCVTKNLEVPDFLFEIAERHEIPLLRTKQLSSTFITHVERFLEDALTATTSLHGVLMDVFSVGVLILGKSGIGKSECALELVARGHRLVADDIVDVKRKAEAAVGAGSAIIQHHIEIRGLGIINVKDLFGVASVREQKKIELVVELVEWDPHVEYDRLGVEDRRFTVLDVEVPMLVLPVRPGRSMTTLIEVAARNHLLKLQGHNSALEFQERLNRAIADGQPRHPAVSPLGGKSNDGGSRQRGGSQVTPQALRIAVITGLSGAGKSTAVRALEDEGFFCIDNLPVPFLQTLVELLTRGGGDITRVALVVDAREGRFLEQAPEVFAEARRAGASIETVFLDASDETLLRRFSETRRRHPLAPDRPVQEGIAEERLRLSGLRRIADELIDTTRLSVHDLRQLVHDRFGRPLGERLVVTLLSFGYRHGLPPQSDMVFDVRFLQNPFFVEELRDKSGLDPAVSAYVLEQPGAMEFLERAEGLCRFLLPNYREEGKSYLTVSIGCTGGRHRSVVIAHELSRRLGSAGERVRVWDRDVELA